MTDNPDDIVPLPPRKPPFVFYWTVAGATASTFFGYWLMNSFIDPPHGQEQAMDVGLILWTAAVMVAVWILIPTVCIAVMSRAYRGVRFDQARRALILMRKQSQDGRIVPLSEVAEARADDDEFDERNALLPGATPLANRATGVDGVTNRELHHDLIIRTTGGLELTVECHSKAQAEAAAARIMALAGKQTA